MSLKIAEHRFTGATAPYSSYDQTKTTLGSLLIQQDNYAGPMPVAIARSFEQMGVPGFLPTVVRKNADTDYIFTFSGLVAATTRHVNLHEFNYTTKQFKLIGVCSLNLGQGTNATATGLKVVIEHYTTGTVSTSGQTVTGVGTGWVTNRMSVGCRIAFGTTDPETVTTWYHIASIASDTSLGLDSTHDAPPALSDVPYVIQDVIILATVSNATATNGGFFVAKGISLAECFTVPAFTVNMATTQDNRRALYWLKDAATITATAARGVDIEPSRVSWTEHYCYIPSGNVTLFKYNFRAPLNSLTSGISTEAYLFKTAVGALTGTTVDPYNNGQIFSLAHGPAPGVMSLWLSARTNIYQVPLSVITDGSTTWVSQSHTYAENPPGTIQTHLAMGLLTSVTKWTTNDRLLIMAGAPTTQGGQRAYATQFKSDPWDHIFLADTRQYDASSAQFAYSTQHASTQGMVLTCAASRGTLFVARLHTSTYGSLYALPLDAHWTYAQTNQQVLITPVLTYTGAAQRLYVNEVNQLGDGTFGLPTEGWRVYYRTSGFASPTGGWTLLEDLKLRGITDTGSIQFMFEFKTLGLTCIPARLQGVGLTYDDGVGEIPQEFRWNLADSNNANGSVGFAQTDVHEFASLTIYYYRSDNDVLLFSQESTGSTNGQFQSNNGTGWVSGLGTNQAGNRIRFVPNAPLPSQTSTYTVLAGNY